ncbi:MAG: 50S ribosomal protein L18 [Candidatus Thermoplasmatota archaeon]|nr:50S ribosomal protein L18 [Candidatus Thermoplasmatota archaeon]
MRQFRRRREGATDYRKRLALLKSGLPRAVVRVTNRQVLIQLTRFTMEGDQVVAAVSSQQLAGLGWKGSGTSVPAAYLTGLLAARKAQAAGEAHAVLDIGRLTPTPGGRVFAVLKGLVDGGMEVPHSDSLYPGEERIRGEPISKATVKQVEKLSATIQEVKA